MPPHLFNSNLSTLYSPKPNSLPISFTQKFSVIVTALKSSITPPPARPAILPPRINIQNPDMQFNYSKKLSVKSLTAT